MNNHQSKSLNIYLDSIGATPRLTDAEEQALASRIAQGDKQAANRLVAANLRYVVKLAGEYAGHGVPMDDLISEGNIGLVKAMGKYTPGMKRFATFAAPYIRQAMAAAVAESGGMPSADAPLGGRQNVTILDIVADRSASSQDDALQDADIMKRLEAAITLLDERQQIVVRAFYGLGRPHSTLSEIALQMNIKRERARQIRDKAMRRLTKADKGLKAIVKTS